MKITIRLFASLREALPSPNLALELAAPVTVAEVKARLARDYPALAAHLPYALAAVNQVYAPPEQVLSADAEVALFPPVSGGQAPVTRCWLTAEPLVTETLVRAITSPAVGAVCTFTGLVRGLTQTAAGPRLTDHLEYEAYAPMAEAQLQAVAAEMCARWPALLGVGLAQRIGTLQPGEVAALVACAAAHRDTGIFEAARYGIDRLKEIVPVWKKEFGPEGAAWV